MVKKLIGWTLVIIGISFGGVRILQFLFQGLGSGGGPGYMQGVIAALVVILLISAAFIGIGSYLLKTKK